MEGEVDTLVTDNEELYKIQDGSLDDSQATPFGKSRYGRTRKPKISQDFYDIDAIFDTEKDPKKYPRVSQQMKTPSTTKSTRIKSSLTDGDDIKDSKIPFVHVTGDSEFEEISSPLSPDDMYPLFSESTFLMDNPELNLVSECNEIETNIEKNDILIDKDTSLLNSEDYKVSPFTVVTPCSKSNNAQTDDDSISINPHSFTSALDEDTLNNADTLNVTEVLKIIAPSTKPGQLDTDTSDSNSSTKPTLKTYTNKRKTFNKAGIESFALPDKPIFPLEQNNPTVNEPKRYKNLDVASTTDMDINLVDKSLLNTPWKIASMNTDMNTSETLLDPAYGDSSDAKLEDDSSNSDVNLSESNREECVEPNEPLSIIEEQNVVNTNTIIEIDDHNSNKTNTDPTQLDMIINVSNIIENVVDASSNPLDKSKTSHKLQVKDGTTNSTSSKSKTKHKHKSGSKHHHKDKSSSNTTKLSGSDVTVPQLEKHKSSKGKNRHEAKLGKPIETNVTSHAELIEILSDAKETPTKTSQNIEKTTSIKEIEDEGNQSEMVIPQIKQQNSIENLLNDQSVISADKQTKITEPAKNLDPLPTSIKLSKTNIQNTEKSSQKKKTKLSRVAVKLFDEPLFSVPDATIRQAPSSSLKDKIKNETNLKIKGKELLNTQSHSFTKKNNLNNNYNKIKSDAGNKDQKAGKKERKIKHIENKEKVGKEYNEIINFKAIKGISHCSESSTLKSKNNEIKNQIEFNENHNVEQKSGQIKNKNKLSRPIRKDEVKSNKVELREKSLCNTNRNNDSLLVPNTKLKEVNPSAKKNDTQTSKLLTHNKKNVIHTEIPDTSPKKKKEVIVLVDEGKIIEKQDPNKKDSLIASPAKSNKDLKITELHKFDESFNINYRTENVEINAELQDELYAIKCAAQNSTNITLIAHNSDTIKDAKESITSSNLEEINDVTVVEKQNAPLQEDFDAAVTSSVSTEIPSNKKNKVVQKSEFEMSEKCTLYNRDKYVSESGKNERVKITKIINNLTNTVNEIKGVFNNENRVIKYEIYPKGMLVTNADLPFKSDRPNNTIDLVSSVQLNESNIGDITKPASHAKIRKVAYKKGLRRASAATKKYSVKELKVILENQIFGAPKIKKNIKEEVVQVEHKSETTRRMSRRLINRTISTPPYEKPVENALEKSGLINIEKNEGVRDTIKSLKTPKATNEGRNDEVEIIKSADKLKQDSPITRSRNAARKEILNNTTPKRTTRRRSSLKINACNDTIDENLHDALNNIQKSVNSQSKGDNIDKNIVLSPFECETPVKKSRGRPRKNIVLQDNTVNNATNTEMKFSPRVRSTKNLLKLASDSTTISNKHKNSIAASSNHQPVSDQKGSFRRASSLDRDFRKSIEYPINYQRRNSFYKAADKNTAAMETIKHKIGLSNIQIGDIVWARFTTCPYWPCLVANDPESHSYQRTRFFKNKNLLECHVRFYGDRGRRAWVSSDTLMQFQTENDIHEIYNCLIVHSVAKIHLQPFTIRSYLKNWEMAVAEAVSMKSKTVQERLDFFATLIVSNLNTKRKSLLSSLNDDAISLNVSELNSKQDCFRLNSALSRSVRAKSLPPNKHRNSEEKAIAKETDTNKEYHSWPLPRFAQTNAKEELSKLLPDESRSLKKGPLQLEKKYDKSANGGNSESSDSDTLSKSSKSTVVADNFKELAMRQKRNHLFKGVTRYRVCQICTKFGDVLKCQGACNGSFHYKCTKGTTVVNEKSFEVITNSTDKTVHSTKPSDTVSSTDDKIPNSKDNSIDSVVSDSSQPEPIVTLSKSFAYSVAEQIDKKMKELMSHQNSYADSTTDYTSSEETSANNCFSIAENVEITNSGLGTEHVSPKPSTLNTNESNHIKHNSTIPPYESTTSVINRQADFKCHYCSLDIAPSCFVCGKEVSDKNVSLRQQCSINKCGRFYHPHCLKVWPQTRLSLISTVKLKDSDEDLDTFVCPAHVCHTCSSDNPRARISRCRSSHVVKCLRCPATYHSSNYCVPAGTCILTASQIICPRHLVTTKKNNNSRFSKTINTSWCAICSKGGDLVCCETCPTSVHAECLQVDFMEDGTFICDDCESGRFPLYDEIVWVKLGRYRWWPATILFPSEVPENIQNLQHNEGEFVVKFFGTHDHFWVGRGRVFLFQEGDRGQSTPTKSKTDLSFKKAVIEAAMAHQQKNAFALSMKAEMQFENKPPSFIRIKYNRAVGNVRTCGDLDTSIVTACECSPTHPNPCGPDSDCLNRILLTECDPNICPAKDNCNNQRFVKLQYPPLEPYKTESRGWGLKTLAPIRKGEFVIEYVGEVIDEQEYQRRIQKMNEQKDENYYFLTIDKDRTIDAGPKGNLARFMNHSCRPNCETQKWTVRGDTRVGLFALENISADSEITFNYHLQGSGKGKMICVCGASNCSGFIGSKIKLDESQKYIKKNGIKRKRGFSTPLVKKIADPCFICGQFDNVGACQNKICTKFYHLKCVNLEVWPDGKWICPCHKCKVCLQRASRCCVKCINSYCSMHSVGNIRYDKFLGFICSEHDPAKESQKLLNHCTRPMKAASSSVNISTEETEVTSTTADESDQIESVTKQALRVECSETSIPRTKNYQKFVNTLQTFEDEHVDFKNKSGAEVIKQTSKRTRSSRKSSVELMSKKTKLLNEVVKPTRTYSLPSILDMTHNEVKLSQTVPTRHLRTTRKVSTTDSEIKQLIKRQSEYEKDLPIRKRARLRCEVNI